MHMRAGCRKWAAMIPCSYREIGSEVQGLWKHVGLHKKRKRTKRFYIKQGGRQGPMSKNSCFCLPGGLRYIPVSCCTCFLDPFQAAISGPSHFSLYFKMNLLNLKQEHFFESLPGSHQSQQCGKNTEPFSLKAQLNSPAMKSFNTSKKSLIIFLRDFTEILVYSQILLFHEWHTSNHLLLTYRSKIIATC